MKKNYYIATQKGCRDIAEYFETISTSVQLVGGTSFHDTPCLRFIGRIQRHRDEFNFHKMYFVECVEEFQVQMAYMHSFKKLAFIIEDDFTRMSELLTLEGYADEAQSFIDEIDETSEKISHLFEKTEEAGNPNLDQFLRNFAQSRVNIFRAMSELHKSIREVDLIFQKDFVIYVNEDE
jgi:hypothetical protein